MPVLYGPLVDCPQCGSRSSYGRCWVEEKTLTFRCTRCPCLIREVLPPIKKSIIYVDQFALSNMIKLKNEPFWAGLHQRLVELAGKNLITCPYSPAHVDESNLSVHLREPLKCM